MTWFLCAGAVSTRGCTLIDSCTGDQFGPGGDFLSPYGSHRRPSPAACCSQPAQEEALLQSFQKHQQLYIRLTVMFSPLQMCLTTEVTVPTAAYDWCIHTSWCLLCCQSPARRAQAVNYFRREDYAARQPCAPERWQAGLKFELAMNCW